MNPKKPKKRSSRQIKRKHTGSAKILGLNSSTPWHKHRRIGSKYSKQ